MKPTVFAIKASKHKSVQFYYFSTLSEKVGNEQVGLFLSKVIYINWTISCTSRYRFRCKVVFLTISYFCPCSPPTSFLIFILSLQRHSFISLYNHRINTPLGKEFNKYQVENKEYWIGSRSFVLEFSQNFGLQVYQVSFFPSVPQLSASL